jgi:hypothetical protein
MTNSKVGICGACAIVWGWNVAEDSIAPSAMCHMADDGKINVSLLT